MPKNNKKTQSKSSNPKTSRSKALDPTHGDRCLYDYAKCLADPFNTPASCVPVFPSPPSRKVKCVYRGRGVTGINSMGMVCVAPQQLPFSNYNSIHYSELITYPTGPGDALSVVAAGIAVDHSNSPYGATEFGNQSDELKYRLVSLGIRVRYAGTQLNRGGTVRAMQSVFHEDMVGNTSYNNMGLYPACKTVPFGNKWQELLWTPVKRDELDYSYVVSNNDVTMLVMIQSAVKDQPFEFEVIGNFEVVGKTIQNPTPSYTSAKTSEYLGDLNNSMFGGGMNATSVFSTVASYLPTLWSEYRNPDSMSNVLYSSLRGQNRGSR